MGCNQAVPSEQAAATTRALLCHASCEIGGLWLDTKRDRRDRSACVRSVGQDGEEPHGATLPASAPRTPGLSVAKRLPADEGPTREREPPHQRCADTTSSENQGPSIQALRGDWNRHFPFGAAAPRLLNGSIPAPVRRASTT